MKKIKKFTNYFSLISVSPVSASGIKLYFALLISWLENLEKASTNKYIVVKPMHALTIIDLIKLFACNGSGAEAPLFPRYFGLSQLFDTFPHFFWYIKHWSYEPLIDFFCICALAINLLKKLPKLQAEMYH